jgi:hypothetical protein
MNHKETIFTEKAKKYFVCFADQCPLHTTCLRWEVGQYVDADEEAILSMNPRNRHIAQGDCRYYQNNQPVKMPIGMSKYFYYDMPRHIEQAIKQSLIDHYGRYTYYRYHSAHRPITPDVLQVIQSVCQRFGWTQPLRFDDEVEDYVW